METTTNQPVSEQAQTPVTIKSTPKEFDPARRDELVKYIKSTREGVKEYKKNPDPREIINKSYDSNAKSVDDELLRQYKEMTGEDYKE